jgi:ABC-type transporter Mla MlaB component
LAFFLLITQTVTKVLGGKMPITMKQSADSYVLVVSGDISLQDVAESKTALVAALKTADKVVLETQDISSIDFAGLQLICSAHRTSMRLGKSIAFSAGLPALLTDAAERIGFSGRRRCLFGEDRACLWKEVAHG